MVDVLLVHANAPAGDAVLTLTLPSDPKEIHCDILVVGGSTGGVAAALAAAADGHTVCMTEETNWVGGQMTSQGVSALDENKFIEPAGAPASYLSLRRQIRAYYKAHYALSPQGDAEANFNPGNCWVSRLCFEPPVGLKVLDSMLAPYETKGLIRLFLRTRPVRAQHSENRITSVLTYNFSNHHWIKFKADYFLDATDLGELLPLAGAAYVTGAEARSTTGEPDAPDVASPDDDQSLTYTFVLKRKSSDPRPASMPPGYQRNARQQPYSLRINYGHGRSLVYGMFTKLPGTWGSFWEYRRLIAPENFLPSAGLQSLSMINWPGNDTCAAKVLSNSALEEAQGLRKAKQVALGFAYWLRHEAPHDQGTGHGYPEMGLDNQEVGTSDGLSQFPYIRESRRIQALQTIKEQQISVLYQKGVRAASFGNSVGIGFYAIDIHGCAKRDFTSKTKPFQLPLGALIPRRITNLLAASKDIGTTHITNGAYREHPEEWTIGTAAGTLAAFSIDHRVSPQEVEKNDSLTLQLQLKLVRNEDPVFWFDDLAPTSHSFAAAQILAAHGIFGANSENLHFNPTGTVEGREAVLALTCALSGTLQRCARDNDLKGQTRALIREGYLPGSFLTADGPAHAVDWGELKLAGEKTGISLPSTGSLSERVTRADFAAWLLRIYLRKAAPADHHSAS